MSDIDTGLNVWQMTSNHNRMIDLQEDNSAPRNGPVELAFFGSSAFRITSPRGVSVMIDPWRNHPSRRWDWYFHDFPIVPVDIGASTHAHFDHDALHRLDAHVLLDRLIGMYRFGDMTTATTRRTTSGRRSAPSTSRCCRSTARSTSWAMSTRNRSSTG